MTANKGGDGMETEVIEYREVVPGDKVYNPHLFHNNKWQEVTKVTNNGRIVSLYLGVSVHPKWDTRSQFCGHPREGIAVIKGRQYE